MNEIMEAEIKKLTKKMNATTEMESHNYYRGKIAGLKLAIRLEPQVIVPERNFFGQWYKPEDFPEELESNGMEHKRLLVKYKFRDKIEIDFGYKTKYEWRLSGSPSTWNDEIIEWMPLPKL